MKSTFTLFVLFVSLVAVQAQAKLSKEQFVAECMKLASSSGRPGPEFNCKARTAIDAKKLQSVGIDPAFELNVSNAHVGLWGDGQGKYFQNVTSVVKSGIFGLGAKTAVVECREKRDGSVFYFKESSINVITQNGVEGVQEFANVDCR